ncbi:MAG TPA: DUF1232 domain-containing protein [Baekduia sp.]|nr:DUF1232 domain-containing protein [Baekduia sp.]
MASWTAASIALGAIIALWLTLLAALALAGRRREALAAGRFVPDCVVLFRRLLADDRLPRSRKLALVSLLVYLASPIDLVPDFIPVIGHVDDAILVVLALRFVLRAGGPELIAEHWPGPAGSREALSRLAFGAPSPQ